MRRPSGKGCKTDDGNQNELEDDTMASPDNVEDHKDNGEHEVGEGENEAEDDGVMEDERIEDEALESDEHEVGKSWKSRPKKPKVPHKKKSTWLHKKSWRN